MTTTGRSKYNAMQTTAFQIADTSAWNRSYHLLRFPELFVRLKARRLRTVRFRGAT